MTDYNDTNVPSNKPEDSPSGGRNQGFTTALIVLGLILLLALALMVGYLFFLRPQVATQHNLQGTQAVLTYAQSTATEMAITQDGVPLVVSPKGLTLTPEALPSVTPSAISTTLVSATILPTETPSLVLQVTNTPESSLMTPVSPLASDPSVELPATTTPVELQATASPVESSAASNPAEPPAANNSLTAADPHTATVAALLTLAATNGAILPTQSAATPTPPAATPTQEVVQPTQVDLQPTQTPLVEPTQVMIQPTQTAVVQPTQVVIQPTQAVIQPTQTEVVQPTQAVLPTKAEVVQPTQGAVQPTQGAAQPTQTGIVPTQNMAQATQGSAQATQVQPTQASSTATQSGSGVIATAVPTASVLPTTGFADEFGIPGLLGLSVAMLIVIVLVRRVRAAG
jgi:hypothetical protein